MLLIGSEDKHRKLIISLLRLKSLMTLIKALPMGGGKSPIEIGKEIIYDEEVESM